MSEPFSVDDILADVRRIEKERSEAEAGQTKLPTAPERSWSMDDIDKLLGVHDALDGISASDYAYTTVTEEPPAPKPVTVGVGRFGQETFEEIQLKPIPKPQLEVPAPPKKEEVPDLEEIARRYRAPEPPEEPERDDLPEIKLPGADTARPRAEIIDIFSNSRQEPEEEVPRAPEPADFEGDGLDISYFTPEPIPEPDDGKTKAVWENPPAARPAHPQTGAEKIREIAHEEVDGQMRLEGFNPNGARVQRIDEEVAEIQLSEERSDILRSFRLRKMAEEYEPDYPTDSEDFLEDPVPGVPGQKNAPHAEDEYRNFKDRSHIIRYIRENRRSAFLSACGLGIIEIILIVLSILAGNQTGDYRSYMFAGCLLLLSVSAAISINSLTEGFKDLFHWKPSCDSAAALMTVFTVAHSIVAFVLPDSEAIPGTFCAAAVFSLLLCKVSKLLEQIAIFNNFTFVAFTYPGKLHAIRPFAHPEDRFEIGKSLMIAEPNLRYSQKTGFPANFMKRSSFRNSIDNLCKIMIPAAAGVAAISALAGWISAKDGLAALSAFTGTLCITLPVGAALTVTLPTVLLMSHLNKKGGMILSPKAASANATISAVALDSADLYDKEKTSLDGYKTYKVLDESTMMKYAGALAVGAGGPLRSIFLQVFDTPDILPPTKNLIYEEKLGISAYIQGQSVLLGNRNLLINHSVEAPPKSVEVPYLQNGQRVLFLAVGNKLAAMFVVSYIENDDLVPFMQVLQNNGIRLVVSAPDSNITEEFLAEGFELTQGEVKLMSPNAAQQFHDRAKEASTHVPVEIMHDGSTQSLMRTLASVATIENIQRIASIAGIIGCAIGWLVAFILMLVQDIGAFNWFFVLIYTAVWILVSTGVGLYQAFKLIKPDMNDIRAMKQAQKNRNA